MLSKLEHRGPFLNFRMFRFLYCSFLAWMLPSREWFFFNSDFGLHQGMIFVPDQLAPQLTNLIFISLTCIMGFCLLLSAIEIRPSWNLAIALFIFVIISQPTEAHLNPYDSNIIFFNLLVLCLSSMASWDDQDLLSKNKFLSFWPLQAIKLNLALVYFSAFISKMVNGNGLEWANGTTLQAHLIERYLMTGNELAGWLAEIHWLCLALSCMTLIAESTFWTILVPTRFTPYIAFSGFLMHVFIYLVMSINFRFFILTYLVFIPYEKIIYFTRSRFYKLSHRTL